MKIPCLVGLGLVMGLSLNACGTGTVATEPKGDGGQGPEATAASGYHYVAIIDVEQQQKGEDFSCSAEQGPGSDIDAVALIRKGETVGYGLLGSAIYSKAEGNQCKDEDCPDGECKYTDQGTTEGPADAEIAENGNDEGYLSLNGGVLQIRIGQKDGQEPGQDILPGDQIKVFEVDETKKTDGRTCAPERYQVLLQKAGSADIELRPAQFDKANASVCGESPASDAQFGCGTSVFEVR